MTGHHDTVVLHDTVPAVPSRKKRRRWPIAIIVIVALLAVAVVATELVLRQVVPAKVADNVREVAGLSADHPVDVELTGFITPQVIRGEFTNARVAVSNVPVQEGIRVDLEASADSFPMNITEAPLRATTVTATLDETQLSNVLRILSRGIGQDLTIDGDDLTISNSLTFFGQSVPINVTFTPSIRDGGLHIEPVGVEAGGILSLTVDQLPDFQIFDDFASGMTICVDHLKPEGVTLTDLALSTTQTLKLTAEIHPNIGMDETLQQVGTC